MPYIFDMPNGRDDYYRRSFDAEPDYNDAELLKLLNGGQRKPVEAAAYKDAYPSYDYAQSVTEDEDYDDDFMLHKRYPRMSFNGQPYPPVPPEASTLARPTDDWSNEDFNSSQYYGGQAMNQSTYLHYDRAFQEPAEPVQPQGNNNVFAYEPEHYVNIHQGTAGYNQQHSVWTPPHASMWGRAYPADFHAPVLHPRLVQLPERPVTPHDTYRYPTSHVEQIHVAPAAPEVPAETINAAFSVWYANQVICLLGTPGSFRPGVGGASEETWGMGGREKDGWLRVGRSPPDYSKPWGRMGMTATPVSVPRRSQQRRPDLEPRDPYNVAWAHAIKPSSSLVNFILDIIQRMTISPTALVSAVWFLHGLGFHEGDGKKGAELREFLREHRSYELESVERRVATLGLMLAGKWLDDNSFLTKSWCEVTTIPVKQLDRMERIALADLHFSLHVPVSSWVDHVNKLYTALVSKPIPDEVDLIVTPLIDDMVTEARNVELDDPLDISPSTAYDRRMSSDELPAAADQAISRDWGSFARTYGISQQEMRDLEVDVEMERAERDVNALVNDDYASEELEDEDEDEEFLDYDGAKKWLPTMSELKRSGSHSSDTSLSSFDSHSLGFTQPTQPFHVPLDLLETPSRQRTYSEWTQTTSKSDRSIEWDSSDFLYPIAPPSASDKCRKCHDCQDSYAFSKPTPKPFQSVGYTKPRTNVVQKARYDTARTLQESQKSNLNYRNYGSASKRWGKPISAVQW
ncbi:uncharacterized protein L201_004457 [Kwoniella dendrophila CBS 6074]|uniref:Cyclin N-terminal domain-containing protein n=1 Tax=Kwoniella dendrophila CBS 6074 TaxID=1295534 RepID=A0AAX4JYD4_9TREE